MKRNYYLIALLMLLTFAFAACSNDDDSSAEETGESEADPAAESPAEEDVVRVWTYPVHGEYEGELEELVRQFEEENEHITIEYEVLSWAEGPQKFDIALNSGSPPDIYFGSPLGKYVSTELAVPIDDLVDVDLSHYNDVAIEGMKLEGQLYGLPLYMFLHVWGGNKQLLEEYGIDYETIQTEGWTWDEFKELASIGEQTNADGDEQYGFVFQGDNEELLMHLAMNNGLPYRMTEDGITWNDERILETLTFIRDLIDDGIMPRETAAIDPHKRMELYYNYQALFFGRAIPYFDPTVANRNQDIDDGVETGEKLDFVLLPIPHHEGEEQVAVGGSEGYLLFTQRGASEEHIANSMKVLEHLTGADAAGMAASQLALPIIHEEAIGKYELPLADYNEEAAEILASHVLAKAEIPSELATKDDEYRAEVVVPTFQGLLAGELTPEEAYETLKTRGEALVTD